MTEDRSHLMQLSLIFTRFIHTWVQVPLSYFDRCLTVHTVMSVSRQCHLKPKEIRCPVFYAILKVLDFFLHLSFSSSGLKPTGVFKNFLFSHESSCQITEEYEPLCLIDFTCYFLYGWKEIGVSFSLACYFNR